MSDLRRTSSVKSCPKHRNYQAFELSAGAKYRIISRSPHFVDLCSVSRNLGQNGEDNDARVEGWTEEPCRSAAKTSQRTFRFCPLWSALRTLISRERFERNTASSRVGPSSAGTANSTRRPPSTNKSSGNPSHPMPEALSIRSLPQATLNPPHAATRAMLGVPSW